MREMGRELTARGLTLRSGGEEGADTAFELGALDADGAPEIFIPWRDFNGVEGGIDVSESVNYSKACGIAAEHHPAWGSLKQSARKRIARDVMKVLGPDLDSPSRFVICWALNPRFDVQKRIRDVSGSTGLAVRLAYDLNIPVFHLDVHAHIKRIDHLCGTNFASQYGQVSLLDPFGAEAFSV